MAYKQYTNDRMSSPLTKPKRKKYPKEISNQTFQRLRSKLARKHGGMTEDEMNRMRERGYQRNRTAADKQERDIIASHMPPAPDYTGWTDFQIQQDQQSRDREISSIRNRMFEAQPKATHSHNTGSWK